MSATPNNAGLGWTDPPKEVPKSRREADGSRNALQALLAFACIHEQATKRRSGAAPSPLGVSQEEEFALDEVLQLVAERAIAITGADGVAIALANENAIVCRASS